VPRAPAAGTTSRPRSAGCAPQSHCGVCCWRGGGRVGGLGLCRGRWVAQHAEGGRDGQTSAVGRPCAAVALLGVLLSLWGSRRGVRTVRVREGVPWGTASGRNGQPATVFRPCAAVALRWLLLEPLGSRRGVGTVRGDVGGTARGGRP